MACFHFQQFDVEHDRSSMKVGTDAVLLGALADLSQGRSFLEIGCGCGVISLMLAQRFPNAHFLAIDIHPPSVDEALRNFRNSPFSSRLDAQHCRLQDLPKDASFDGLFSNPPFFRNSSICPDRARSGARHDLDLDLSSLFSHAARLLTPKGSLQIILPSTDRLLAEDEALKNALFLRKHYALYASNADHPKRSILFFGKTAGTIEDTKIPLQQGKQASPEYQQLLGEFLTIYQSK